MELEAASSLCPRKAAIIDFVKGYFRHLADSLGEMPPPDRFSEEGPRAVARRFFAFKLIWPYRSTDANRFGRFYFDGAQHMILPIDYETLRSERSKYDGIFLSLASVFRDREELLCAEAMVRENIEALAKACGNPG